MKDKKTPYEKAVSALKNKYRDVTTNEPIMISSVIWKEFLYKYVSSAVPEQKHANELLIYRGIISRANQDGFILHISKLKEEY